MNGSIQVGLSQEFLKSLSALPNAVQAKVLAWALKFQANPTANGINYEKINAAKDSQLRSVRIDQDWRGIVFKPTTGNLYVMLYVDHHDDAYRWAANRKMTINPVTGAMQLLNIETVVRQETVVETTYIPPALFASHSDTDLMSIGVPEECLALVRDLRSEDELDGLVDTLPVEGYEGLFLLMAGDSIDQVLISRETRVDQRIDTTDFVQAIQRAESMSRFIVVENDAALLAIMNAPLAQWRTFLHPTQLKLSQGQRSGSMRVLGGAGTGKTVLAMHRAKWLAEHATADGQKVLFTTYTRNLATDIEHNLKQMCSPDTLAKIEVRNLDAWVYQYLRSQRYEHRILYNRHKEGKEAWTSAMAIAPDALNFSEQFYEDELEQVVLAQGAMTLDDYRQARRVGRGVILNRAKRDAIWPVFEEYRSQLRSRQLKEVDDAFHDAALALRAAPLNRYSAIVIDETQDFGQQALRLLRAIIAEQPNDLFFVGDGHQRIYKRHLTAMSRCGINIVGRSRKLYINYRTTDEIRRKAVALLSGVEVDDLDDGLDNNSKYKSLSHGPDPIDETCASLEELQQKVVDVLAAWASDDANALATTCVMTSSIHLRGVVADFLSKQGFAVSVLEALDTDSAIASTIRVSTMHRAKGLEFDHVIVLDDLRDDHQQDPKLLYVALTRAKVRAALLRI